MDNVHSISESAKTQSKNHNPHLINLRDKLGMCHYKTVAIAEMAANEDFSSFDEEIQHGCLLALKDLVIQAYILNHELNEHLAGWHK